MCRCVAVRTLEDAKKHAREIYSVENTIEFMEKREKCIILAAKNDFHGGCAEAGGAR